MATTRSSRGRGAAARAMTDDYFALVRRCPLKHIRDDAGLRAAHAMVDELTRIPEGRLTSGQAEYLEALGDLVSVYEADALRDMTSGVAGLDLLRHLLDENDMSASDLGRLIGHRELGSKILRGERQITRDHAAKLAGRFGLPAETFMR